MIKINPKVSIIILNYNGIAETIKCLNSLKKTKYNNFEIIVIDNGSEKNENNLIAKNFPKFAKIYRLEINLGFTGGNNWALKKTKGKYIVLLNNDTIVDPNWLTPLVRLLEKDRKIAIVQPKIKLMNKKSFFDYAGAAGGYIDRYGFPFTRGRIFNTQEKDSGQYDGEFPIFWASGAACIIRKSIIKKVGGFFNENLFNYMEEIDLCWRVWRAGYKVMFTSTSVIYHKVAATAGKNVIQKRYWEHRNNLYILVRNLTKKEAIKILPIRFLLELIAYVYYIISKQKPFIKSLFLAHKDFIKNGFYIRLYRNRDLNHKTIPIYPGSIIFDHYIKKKKYFTDLRWSAKGNFSFLVYKNSQNTGSEVIFKMANKLIDKGFSARIYTLFGNKQNWYELNTSFRNIFHSFFQFKPDYLISTFWPTAYILPFMRSNKKYFFSQDWGPSLHEFILFKILAKNAYKIPANIIVHSNFLEEKVKENNRNSQVYKIKYNVLGNEFKRYIKNKNISKQKKSNKKIKILSVISWYTYCKGLDNLEEIITNLHKKYKNYYFTLVSREKKSFTNNIDKFVSNPSKSQIAKLYNDSDIFLSTSRTEGMPITGLEAMACGCLFITTDSGGVKNYAINDYNSIIISQPKDIWEKKIIEHLFKNEKKVEMLINNGYKTANQYWEDNIIEDFHKIFS
ncbi:hypothetical protein A2Z22_00260 [Candidatus Woesebacteria bacterium RBG_16_34_12]|uniref:Glycosyltransferase 2-like domain-containing protein n=1 Tax=Candidatus Woesebacteria bacterium RBG_16_34_12 TaxID=1802480 RepID=A0A1F7X9M2_9BACT|nr:MAG: hypothetical protein A2Z22_00260 [Candidatus Woesebacteria bacterium RBG_16_34_12]